MARLIARTPLPPVLLPFLVATLERLVQGSGTVAMITSASVTAPILATAGVNPVLAAQAAPRPWARWSSPVSTTRSSGS